MAGITRRLVSLVLLAGIFVLVMMSSNPSVRRLRQPIESAAKNWSANADVALPPEELLTGKAIAPKLKDEEAKAELGRASWKVFHTVLSRFPEKPTGEESEALRSYIHLFQRLYPCGDCAEHFGRVLEKFPPQTSSRSIAAGWGCHVHNEVNKRLGKDIFDCNNIGDFYKCGCDEEDAVREAESPISSLI